jgi:polyhydroxyalkanoate synthesis repressor PhaR
MPNNVKKYANRRLYDSTGAAMSPDDFAMIVSGDKVKVIDDKSGEDLTRAVLLQVISEQNNRYGRLEHRAAQSIIGSTGNPVGNADAVYG